MNETEMQKEMDRGMEIHNTLKSIRSAYSGELVGVKKWDEAAAEYVSDKAIRKVGSFPWGDPNVISEAQRWAARKDAVLTIFGTEEGYELYALTEKDAAKSSGGCFIATAAYGSPLASEVIFLSRFRDEILLNSKFGILCVSFYYCISPPLASFISKAAFLQATTRVLFIAPILRLLKAAKFNS